MPADVVDFLQADLLSERAATRGATRAGKRDSAAPALPWELPERSARPRTVAESLREHAAREGSGAAAGRPATVGVAPHRPKAFDQALHIADVAPIVAMLKEAHDPVEGRGGRSLDAGAPAASMGGEGAAGDHQPGGPRAAEAGADVTDDEAFLRALDSSLAQQRQQRLVGPRSSSSLPTARRPRPARREQRIEASFAASLESLY